LFQFGLIATAGNSGVSAALQRRGEATAVFLDDDPSLRYLPAVFYYQGRAREGLLSPGARESYQKFLAIRTGSERDPLIAHARRRLK
jgi:hypothetical protein